MKEPSDDGHTKNKHTVKMIQTNMGWGLMARSLSWHKKIDHINIYKDERDEINKEIIQMHTIQIRLVKQTMQRTWNKLY